jgi:hypothetical protein
MAPHLRNQKNNSLTNRGPLQESGFRWVDFVNGLLKLLQCESARAINVLT